MKTNILTRYRVIVLGLKSRRFPVPEDGIFVSEGDTFYGYSYAQHREGKFFDLWFTRNKEQDSQNLVTFGRIQSIDNAAYMGGTLGNAQMYTTKMGQFLVEEVGLATGEEVFYGETNEDKFS